MLEPGASLPEGEVAETSQSVGPASHPLEHAESNDELDLDSLSAGEGADAGSAGSGADDGANTTIFVGSIPFEATETDIVQFFSSCGAITNTKLLLDPHTRRFKGSCFIRFETQESAQGACALNGNTLMGRKLYISMSTSRPASSPYVFIGNLDPSLDIDSLYQFFSSCGSVVNIKLITDKFTGRHRGFGFVEFADDHSAKNSLALNGTMLGSRPIRVDFQRPKARSRPRTLGGRGRLIDNHFSQSPHHLAGHLHPHAQPLPWPPASATQYHGHPFPPPPNFHMHPHHLSGQPVGMPHPHHHHHHGAATYFPPPSRPMHYPPPHHHPTPPHFQGYFPVGAPGPFPFHYHLQPAESPDHHASPSSPSPATASTSQESIPRSPSLKQQPPPTSPTQSRQQSSAPFPYASMVPVGAPDGAGSPPSYGYQIDPYLPYGQASPNFGPSSPPLSMGPITQDHFE